MGNKHVNNQTENNSLCSKRIIEQEYHFWDPNNGRFLRTMLLIIDIENKKIEYSQGGSIIRIDPYNNTLKKHDLLQNLEQIRNLKWFGQFSTNQKKNGKWTATWNGQALLNVGGLYFSDTEKQGLWKELMNNFWDQSQIYQCGEYQNNQRIGKWNNIYKSVEIGGGQYYIQNGFEIKQGKWIELSHQFWEYGQVIYEGEYEKNKKIGLWNIYYKINQKEKYELIGGGIYDSTKGENIKIGKWFELSDQFWNKKQIFYEGLYNENGIKVGRWNIYFKDQDLNYKKILTGGGEYINHNEVSEIKIGRWIELSDGFYQSSQVTYNGLYKNGKKLGRWDILFNGKQIGGGSYNDSQDSNYKLGKWIELSENFCNLGQITYIGEYRNGKKVGRWDTFYKGHWSQNNEKIGNGQYDGRKGREGIKIGRWIELSDDFHHYSQVTYNGEYQQGKKFGRWDISYKGQQIGGGSYDDSQGNNYKKGKWIDLSNRFREYLIRFNYYPSVSQVSYVGEYQNGIKVGRWDIYFKNDDTNGGGIYDSKEIKGKIGNWVEPNEGFWMQIISSDLTQLFQYFRYNQAIFKGEYKNGKKVGKWLTIFKGEQIGGGLYDDQDGKKIGKWIELDDKFGEYLNRQYFQIYFSSRQVFYFGEYINGKKVGIWDIYNNDANSQINQQIGGGLYDDQKENVKIGRWIELTEGFWRDCQSILFGQYNKNGKKIGQWDEMKKIGNIFETYQKISEKNYGN